MKIDDEKRKRRRRGPSAVKVSSVTEWTGFDGLNELFGVRRSTAYHLCQTEPMLQGASISLKGEHETRGKRLFSVSKFRAFLESRQIGA